MLLKTSVEKGLSGWKRDSCVLIIFETSFEMAQLVQRVAFWFDSFVFTLCLYRWNIEDNLARMLG